MATKTVDQLKRMSLAKLEEYSQKLTGERDALSAEHKDVQRVLDGKRAMAAAAEHLAAMPEGERAALLELTAGGIDSLEQFGTPG